MVGATLIAACIACLAAGVMSLACSRMCEPSKRSYRLVAGLVWISLTALYLVAYLSPDIYLVKSGILTRFLVVMMAVIYSGELLLERKP